MPDNFIPDATYPLIVCNSVGILETPWFIVFLFALSFLCLSMFVCMGVCVI